jgi:hypothetical protein
MGNPPALPGDWKSLTFQGAHQEASSREPPSTCHSKYAVSHVVGYIKGKSAIHLARVYGEHKRNFVGQSFWARGYFVSTVGRDETLIREYIRDQEQEDKRTGSTEPVALICHL